MPDWMTLASTPQWMIDATPAALQAVLLVVVGWPVALLASWLVRRVIVRVADVVLLPTAGRQRESEGFERAAVRTLGRIVFWTVLALFVAAASEAVGITVITDVLREVAAYVPNLAAVVLIVVAGVIAGNLVRTTVRRGAVEAQPVTTEARRPSSTSKEG